MGNPRFMNVHTENSVFQKSVVVALLTVRGSTNHITSLHTAVEVAADFIAEPHSLLRLK